MSIAKTVIGEHDVVTLRNPVEGFPAGTRGAVIVMSPKEIWVEVVDESDDWGYRTIFVPPDQLEVVWKSPHNAGGD
jgi:predicted SPOUT superfamily RNA methylase MTH1